MITKERLRQAEAGRATAEQRLADLEFSSGLAYSTLVRERADLGRALSRSDGRWAKTEEAWAHRAFWAGIAGLALGFALGWLFVEFAL